jgi:hypothetical protein
MLSAIPVLTQCGGLLQAVTGTRQELFPGAPTGGLVEKDNDNKEEVL